MSLEHVTHSRTKAKQKKPISVNDLAAKCLKKADYDRKTAAELMRKLLDNDPALKDSLIEPMLNAAIWDAIRYAAQSHNAGVWRPTQNPDRASVDGALFRVAQTERDRLMSYILPIPGGLVLADATRKDVTSAADFLDKQARGAAQKSRWMWLVSEALPDDSVTAGKALTESKLRSLEKKASAS